MASEEEPCRNRARVRGSFRRYDVTVTRYGDSALYCRAAPRVVVICMARLARVIVPDVPYHVTQRGNGGQRTFFSDDDFALYRDFLGEACREANVGVWAWCL